MIGFVVLCSLIAVVACLLSPKKYLSIATALPANSALSDRARLFNQNIQYLYSELGNPDELDRIEGTALLDTLYIAAAEKNQLAAHYGIRDEHEVYEAAAKLKKNSTINRSAYGELKIRVWDKDPKIAAHLANDLLERLQALHQQIISQGNAMILDRLKKDLALRQEQYMRTDTAASHAPLIQARKTALLERLTQQEKLIGEYELSLSTNPQVLITVERARPSLSHDRPDLLQALLLTAFSSALFFFLLVLLVERRKL